MGTGVDMSANMSPSGSRSTGPGSVKLLDRISELPCGWGGARNPSWGSGGPRNPSSPPMSMSDGGLGAALVDGGGPNKLNISPFLPRWFADTVWVGVMGGLVAGCSTGKPGPCWNWVWN